MTGIEDEKDTKEKKIKNLKTYNVKHQNSRPI
jgi:hypothetical protein